MGITDGRESNPDGFMCEGKSDLTTQASIQWLRYHPEAWYSVKVGGPRHSIERVDQISSGQK